MTVYAPTRPIGQALPPGTNLSPMTLTAHTTSETPLTIVGAPGQTGYLLSVYNGSGQFVDYITQNGNLATLLPTYFFNSTGIGASFDSNGNLNITPPSGGASLVLNSAGNQDGIFFQHNGTNLWTFAVPNAASYFELYDSVNGRPHMIFGAGATAAAATTEISSLLQVDGSISIQPPVASQGTYLYLNPNAAQAGIQWSVSSTPVWQVYMTPGDQTLYFRDMVNARMQIYFLAGASNNAAITYINTATQIAGTLAVLTTGSATPIMQVTNPNGNNSLIQNVNGYLQLSGGVGIGITGVSIGQSAAFATFNDTAFSLPGVCVLLGQSAPANTTTSGFPYMPSQAGTPTGVPTAQAGYVPFRYDTTAHKLWIYDAGWKGVVVA